MAVRFEASTCCSAFLRALGGERRDGPGVDHADAQRGETTESSWRSDVA